MHGHTYNANPLTCAVGHAVLEETERLDLIANADRMGSLLMAEVLARCSDGLARDGLI